MPVGDSITPEEMIQLPIIVDTQPSKATIRSNFLVVKDDLSARL